MGTTSLLSTTTIILLAIGGKRVKEIILVELLFPVSLLV